LKSEQHFRTKGRKKEIYIFSSGARRSVFLWRRAHISILKNHKSNSLFLLSQKMSTTQSLNRQDIDAPSTHLKDNISRSSSTSEFSLVTNLEAMSISSLDYSEDTQDNNPEISSDLNAANSLLSTPSAPASPRFVLPHPQTIVVAPNNLSKKPQDQAPNKYHIIVEEDEDDFRDFEDEVSTLSEDDRALADYENSRW
jgi:hypothetical protein